MLTETKKQIGYFCCSFWSAELYQSGEDRNDGRMKDTVSSNLQKKYDLAENPDEIEQLSRLSDSSEEPAVFAGNIGSLGSDGELDQGGSPYTPKAMKAHKTSFESGKAVNLNYFIANRGKVMEVYFHDKGSNI